MSKPDSSSLRYPATDWIVLQSAATRRARLDRLLAIYAPPLHSYLIAHHRLDDDAAAQVLHALDLPAIVRREAETYQRPATRSVRSHLLASLNRELPRLLRASGLERRGDDGVSDDELDGRGHLNQGSAFERLWRWWIISAAMRKMVEQCRSLKQRGIWQCFALRLERSSAGAIAALTGEKPPTALPAGWSVQVLCGAVVAGRRMFQRSVRGLIAQYMGEDPAAISGELARLHTEAEADRESDESDGSAAGQQAAAITAMLGEAARDGDVWSDAELAFVLAQQMHSPLAVHSARSARTGRTGTKGKGGSSQVTPWSLRDLLTASEPPAEVLESVKRMAKSLLERDAAGVPKPIATFYYHLSLALARVRLNQRLTRLDDGAILEGARWVIAQPWLDSRTRLAVQELVRELERSARPAN